MREPMLSLAVAGLAGTNWTWAENLRVLRETRFSRYPIVNAEDMKPVGVLHVKDLALTDTAQPIDTGRLKELARPGLEMPEDLSLTDALARFPVPC